MPTTLPAADPVITCLGSLANLLRTLPVRYLMTNGKIECQLTSFMGMAWEGSDPATRAYSLDKKPFKLELDLLAMEDAAPVFWSEVKCSVSQDWGDINKCINEVLLQTTIRHRQILTTQLPCPGYIIHFLATIPSADEKLLHPQVMSSFNKLRKSKKAMRPHYQASNLKFTYETFLPGQYEATAVVPIWTHPDGIQPTVFAVVVKLQRATP